MGWDMSETEEPNDATAKARELAESVDLDDLPREGTYRIVAAYAMSTTETVAEGIEGYYHALYLRDRIEEEHGYIGVSFTVEEDD